MNGIEQMKLKNFTKDTNFNSAILKEMFLSLSGAEMQVVIHLSCFINNDNVITYNQKPFSITEFSKYITENYDTSRTQDTYRKILSSLIKKDVIKKKHLSLPMYNINKNILIFNPWICSKSNIQYLEILNLFKESRWKKIIDNEPTSRNSFEYIMWENDIKKRDDNKCVICGNSLDIEVHHIIPYSNDYDNRINVDNGICLCKRHHNSKINGSFHNVYGTVNNTPEQLLEYIKTKRKELGITDTSFIKSPLLLEHIEEL